MTSGVYQILNIKNGKKYIGSSVNIEDRWNQSHLRLLRQGTHQNSHLQNAWNKYGEEAFVFSIIEECDPECLIEKEQSLLPEDKTYGALKKNGFYNESPTAGSLLGVKHSEQSRLNMSIAHRDQQVSEEARKKISEKTKASWQNPEFREKALKGRKGRKMSQESINKYLESRKNGKGWTITEETRKKMSDKKKGKVPWNTGRKLSPETIAKRQATRKRRQEERMIAEMQAAQNGGKR